MAAVRSAPQHAGSQSYKQAGSAGVGRCTAPRLQLALLTRSKPTCAGFYPLWPGHCASGECRTCAVSTVFRGCAGQRTSPNAWVHVHPGGQTSAAWSVPRSFVTLPADPWQSTHHMQRMLTQGHARVSERHEARACKMLQAPLRDRCERALWSSKGSMQSHRPECRPARMTHAPKCASG